MPYYYVALSLEVVNEDLNELDVIFNQISVKSCPFNGYSLTNE